MIKNIKKESSQRKKFEVYGSKARGLSRANHALSICVGSDGKVIYESIVQYQRQRGGLKTPLPLTYRRKPYVFFPISIHLE